VVLWAISYENKWNLTGWVCWMLGWIFMGWLSRKSKGMGIARSALFDLFWFFPLI
jgi:hypothetical protein